MFEWDKKEIEWQKNDLEMEKVIRIACWFGVQKQKPWNMYAKSTEDHPEKNAGGKL